MVFGLEGLAGRPRGRSRAAAPKFHAIDHIDFWKQRASRSARPRHAHRVCRSLDGLGSL